MEPMVGPWVQRAMAAAVIVPASVVSLPIAASVLDHPPGRENWILPAAAAGSIGTGAAVGSLLPGIAGAEASRLRSAAVGAGIGLASAVAGTAALFLLITDR